ncbi:unnamed protein product [Leptosia nina]|uniref:Cell cycle checkpoint control protein RAD9A n=1 Tax=Leptosia nina TaxID=320188 RepID=A0AAV1IYT1_9NEOP
MKCLIPGPNVKVLGRTIHALARFGDELYLESSPEAILLRTLNASESAYAMVKFNKVFFSYFNYNYFSAKDQEGLKCKISMKSALHAFKSPTHMDKQVENLEIRLDAESCKLIFIIKCKHGIVKTHFVSILDCKAMQAVYTKDLVHNRITSSQKILSEALGNFQSSDDQVNIEVNTESLILRNYVDSSMDLSKVIRTQISIKSAEFDTYVIGRETVITFTIKEFRALLAFAEALNLPLQLHFEVTGKPVVFIVHNNTTFEAHFVLATTKSDTPTQTSASQNSTITDRKRKEMGFNSNSVRKKPNLDVDVSKCLDEDSHLFDYIEMPIDIINAQNNDCSNKDISQSIIQENVDCDNIPPSPTSKMKIKTIFKRCFESTFDPRSIRGSVLAENSDSE